MDRGATRVRSSSLTDDHSMGVFRSILGYGEVRNDQFISVLTLNLGGICCDVMNGELSHPTSYMYIHRTCLGNAMVPWHVNVKCGSLQIF